MEEPTLTIDNLERIQKAETLQEVWGSMNNDQWFRFQVFYKCVNLTEDTARGWDDSPANTPKIRETVDCMMQVVAVLNDILSLDPEDREADWRRCEALLRILQKETDLGRSDDEWTPFKRLLTDVTMRLAVDFGGGSAPNPDENLIVLS
jgi:hypothetical protein